MDDAQADRAAFDTAERLLGAPLVLPLGPGEPPSGADFRRLATRHTFGDSWTRTGLDVRSRALVSVTIAATPGTREPLRGQLRIALSNGVTKDEIVDLYSPGGVCRRRQSVRQLPDRAGDLRGNTGTE